MRLRLALLSALVASCSLEQVPLEDLECPCGPGFMCTDPTSASGVCVPEGATVNCGRADLEAGSLSFVDFEVAWATPNGLRLEWDLENFDDASGYEVLIGSTLDEVLTDDARVIGPGERPELGRGYLPYTSSGQDAVRSTDVAGLASDTQYFVRILAFDSSGGVSCTSVANVFTAVEPLNPPFIVFGDRRPDGAFQKPSCTETLVEAADAYEGDGFLSTTFVCRTDSTESCGAANPGEELLAVCWENVGLISLEKDVSAMNAGAFESAFVELAVAIESDTNGYWAELALVTPGLKADVFLSLRSDGEYQLVQIPLREFTVEATTTPLSRELLGDTVSQVFVGTSLQHESVMRLDSISIRY